MEQLMSQHLRQPIVYTVDYYQLQKTSNILRKEESSIVTDKIVHNV